MKFTAFLGLAAAVCAHAAFLLFGGLLFPGKGDAAKVQDVQLLSEEVTADEEKKEEPREEPPDSTETMDAEEEVPDAAEIIRSLELSSATEAPALEAASLSAIEQALSGLGGGAGDFGEALTFSSGGRIGGLGKAGALEEKLEEAFNLTEIDQKPRVTFKTDPVYPAEARGKKIEGVVSVIFVVDASGKVASPRVERSNLPVFDRPALEAVKQWKFEPAVRGGQRVACKMKVSIRFPASG